MNLRRRTALTTTLLALLVLLCLLPTAQAFHHPRLGRFVQRDAAEYNDSMSLYQYQRQQPVAHSDPSGEVVVLAHGIDGTSWYGRARSEAKKRFPKEAVVEFQYELAEPRTQLVFEPNRIVMDSTYPENAFKRFIIIPLPHKEPLTCIMESTMDFVFQAPPLLEKLGVGRYAVSTALLPPGMKAVYPAGKKISLYVGSLSPMVELPAALRLAMLLREQKIRCPGEKIRFLGYSSGTRMLALAYRMGAPSVDRVVFAGSSVPRNNLLVGLRSGKVVNYYSESDFVTYMFPAALGIGIRFDPPVPRLVPVVHFGGAGTWGLPEVGGVDNEPVKGMFHGDWMSRGMIAKYMKDLE